MSFVVLIFKNLLRQRVRTGLTILGISIGITTVVALGVITTGMKQTLSEMLSAGDADFMVAQNGASDFTFSTVTEDELQAITARDDVAWAHGFLWHVVPVGSNAYFVLAGVEPADLAESPPESVQGALLQPGAPDDIMLGEGAATNLGASIGDMVTIDQHTFHVVGIFRTGATLQDSGAFTSLETVRALANKPDVLTGISVKLRPGGDVEQVAAEIEAASSQVTTLLSIDDFGKVDQGMEIMDALNLAVSVLAVGIGAIGVMNTMIMSVYERTREIGILRAVGWSGQRILRMIVTESLLLCAVAAGVGLLLGVLATRALLTIETIQAFLEPTYTAEILLRAIMVAVVVALVGAIYPAFRAVRLTPMEALRHE
jgi:putative ABC transport system permease protein